MRSNCQNFIKDWISSKDSRCPGPVLLCLASLEMCFVDEDEAVSWEECIIIINLWRHDSKARTVISIPLCPGCSMLHFITGHLDAEVGCQMALPVPPTAWLQILSIESRVSGLFSEIVKRQFAAHYVGYHQILTENQTNSTLVPSSHRDRQWKGHTVYFVTTSGQIVLL